MNFYASPMSRLITPVVIATFLSLSACSNVVQTHGRLIEAAELEQVQIGTTTRADIISLFGQPSFEGAFNSGRIYYNQQTMLQKVAGLNTTQSRELIMFSFDENNMLLDVEIKDEKSDISIATSERKTPTPGQNLTVIDQIFSNLRRRVD